jgi:transportin-1
MYVQMLKKAKSSPDINNYLVYIFSSTQPPPGVDLTTTDYFAVRSAAAVMLKNNIKVGYKKIAPDSIALIKSTTRTHRYEATLEM